MNRFLPLLFIAYFLVSCSNEPSFVGTYEGTYTEPLTGNHYRQTMVLRADSTYEYTSQYTDGYTRELQFYDSTANIKKTGKIGFPNKDDNKIIMCRINGEVSFWRYKLLGYAIAQLIFSEDFKNEVRDSSGHLDSNYVLYKK